MFRKKEKTILPDLIFSKFFLIFSAFLFFVVLFGLAKGTVRNYRVNTEVQDLQIEISRLEGQNQEFTQLVNYLNTEDYIEQEAKLKMGLKKEGENLVIIPIEELSNENIIEDNSQTELSNPSKWWKYFFN